MSGSVAIAAGVGRLETNLLQVVRASRLASVASPLAAGLVTRALAVERLDTLMRVVLFRWQLAAAVIACIVARKPDH